MKLKEHTNNVKYNPSRLSVISEHILNNDHNLDWENVKILEIEQNFYKRMNREMIHIKEQINGINCIRDIADFYYGHSVRNKIINKCEIRNRNF